MENKSFAGTIRMKNKKSLRVIIFIVIIFSKFSLHEGSYVYAKISSKGLMPFTNYKILLDPGHGGSDPGAIGPTGLKESFVNLKVANYLSHMLRILGANVYLTRTEDKYISLEERLNIARKIQPDIFISIHHNSSYEKKTQNYSEFYYNPNDAGMSYILAKALANFYKRTFKVPTFIKPGGFFILRNNYYPSVLIEGHFINIEEVEKKLKSNTFLILQAQAIKNSLLSCLHKLNTNVEILGNQPFDINTMYAKFVLYSSQPIASFSYVSSPPIDYKFKLEKTLFSDKIYVLYNTLPFINGEYKTAITFYSNEGISKPVLLNYIIKLQPSKAKLIPVLDFIPAYFDDVFPIEVLFYDNLNRLIDNMDYDHLNIKAYANGVEIIISEINKGKALLLLDMKKFKQNFKNLSKVRIEIKYKDHEIGCLDLPILNINKRIIFGKITDANNNKALDKSTIFVETIKFAKSNSFGYFMLLIPKYLDNLNITIYNRFGYTPTKLFVTFPKNTNFIKYNIQTVPIFCNLIEKKVAILCGKSFFVENKKIVKLLKLYGLLTARYDIDYSKEQTLFEAVKNINLHNNFDLILSLKFSNNNSKISQIRYYHRSNVGKKIASKISKQVNIHKLTTHYGSDYEIVNTGAPALVLEFPQKIDTTKIIKTILLLLKAWNESYE